MAERSLTRSGSMGTFSRRMAVREEDKEAVAATIEYGDHIALFDQQSTGFVHNDISRCGTRPMRQQEKGGGGEEERE